MTSGAKHLGERGRRLGDAGSVLVAICAICGTDDGSSLASNSSNSNVSSSTGPDMHDIILSPNICCLQLFPGALIDLS
jgi:hypothetical protein